MEKDPEYYLTTETAVRICRQGDKEGMQHMLASLSRLHKASFFRRVVFAQASIPPVLLEELAENVFLQTWETFVRKLADGSLIVGSPEYTGLFFVMFKRGYLRELGKELRRVRVENEYGRSPMGAESPTDEAFSLRTRQALEKIGENCRQLLTWRYIEGLSHDAIAVRKRIDRASSIKMVSRCGRRFAELWRSIVHQF
ncbi:MAG TPA: hypothetical protein VL547_06430 [Dinghuibacter sp.]|jgi:DNA-directed RNA polymerase specialized sigma24 family protein|uniref:RNA polymerase sigma factor n=1 Tax=Dinghuibacter sp. TaxID=2024697 RepID=UPI002BB8EFA1|nr:hypothetical protein [Dinghuibacter sp.]HTJ11639.1 hypothetical protein [Dinghuibacter sp.]